MKKRVPSYTVGENVKVQPLWRTVWRYIIKLKTEPPCDSEIPLLGIYLDKTFLEKKYIHLYVHYSTIYNNQDMETTSMSTDK